MTTNFLRLFKEGSARLALVVGASRILGWDWVAGRIYNRSGEDAAGSGLSNGIRIQIYGDWLNDRLLDPFHCFLNQQQGDCFLLLP